MKHTITALVILILVSFGLSAPALVEKQEQPVSQIVLCREPLL